MTSTDELTMPIDPQWSEIREGVRRLAGVMEQETAMRKVFGPMVGRVAPGRGQAGADVPGPDLA